MHATVLLNEKSRMARPFSLSWRLSYKCLLGKGLGIKVALK